MECGRLMQVALAPLRTVLECAGCLLLRSGKCCGRDRVDRWRAGPPRGVMQEALPPPGCPHAAPGANALNINAQKVGSELTCTARRARRATAKVLMLSGSIAVCGVRLCVGDQ